MAGHAWILMFAALFVSPAPAQTGTVSGQLLNERGLPAVGVRVAAMPVPRDGESGVPTLIGLTLTDNSGRYTLEMIEPGSYYVTAGRVDAPSYYPGVNAASSAKSILVTSGARISGIDFKTAQPLTYSVSGRVVLQPGQNLPPLSRMTLAGASRLETSVNSDGMFEFNPVAPGEYTLRLSRDPFSAMAIVVADRMTGIEFRLGIVSVTASVVMEDGTAAPNVSLSFKNVAQNRTVDVTTRGPFSFYAPEGEYQVTARLRNGYQVKSLTAGNADLLNGSLKLSSTEPAVAVTLTLNTAPIVPFHGRAVSPQGVLQPVRSIRMEQNGAEPVHGTIQPEGSFSFNNVSPGEYTAVLTAGSQESRVRVAVPLDGRRNAEIVIPNLRQLAARLTIESNVPTSANPVVTLRFVGAAGDTVPLTLDGSAREIPLKFSLRDGQYRVSATIRESAAEAGRTGVKTLTSGKVDLLTSPLKVAEDVEEIRITIGR
jgi:hypothetical protein